VPQVLEYLRVLKRNLQLGESPLKEKESGCVHVTRGESPIGSTYQGIFRAKKKPPKWGANINRC
jgi:hypothetical protein